VFGFGGKKFSTNDEVKEAMHGYAVSQKSFSRKIQELIKRWRICIECDGDYVEK